MPTGLLSTYLFIENDRTEEPGIVHARLSTCADSQPRTYTSTQAARHNPDPHQDVLQLSCLGQKANTGIQRSLPSLKSKPTFTVYR